MDLKMLSIISHLLFVTCCLQLQQGLSQTSESSSNVTGTISKAGSVTQLGGMNSYVAGPPQSKLTVILASDIFGFDRPNIRPIADKVASTAGFRVVVPDFFHGEPFNPNNTQRNKTVWIKDHSTAKGFQDAKRLIEDLRKKGAKTIGAAGFCWGGKVVAELAKGNLINMAVLLHPSDVTLDDIKAVKTPMSILVAQLDNATPPQLMKQFQGVLTTNKVDNFMKIYPGVMHGWTLKYTQDNATSVKIAYEAHKDMLYWFIKHAPKS